MNQQPPAAPAEASGQCPPTLAARACKAGAKRSLTRVALAASALVACGPSQALNFGPFTLSGFAKAEVGRVSSYCPPADCQVEKFASRHFIWSDELVQGRAYGAGTTDLTLFQPYLSAKFDLPRGFKASGLLSQRWRDGKVDFPGFLYDASLGLEHEDYGSLRIGTMTTRAWSMADFPFGTNIGVGDAWASSGAGYGLLANAIRYTSRIIDVMEGNLVVEGTYDPGKLNWKKNKPQFLEVWVHYDKGDLSMDFMFQTTRNGPPVAFGHAPFSALFRDRSFDEDLGGSGQSIVMLMAAYQIDSKLSVNAGIRGNRWSGAYAKFLQSRGDNPEGFDVWNEPFNVDWSRDLGGGVYRGYPATSVDMVVGARYKINQKWTASTGMVYLGPAATANPSDRGQSNSAAINSIGLSYDYRRGLQIYGSASMVNYARKGLAPLTMPSHSAFSGIDSRLETRGNWFTVGAVYTF